VPESNNKRIARNTAMLYFRMLLIMAVSLFTLRVVLKTLGTTDYGIYNVVGAIVVMFSFFSNTMASASQRFFAFELGRNDIPQLKKTFSLTITIYAIIAVIVLILAETIGLWLLNTQMVIPANRMEAANWVYQFSVLSFLITIITIPYNAAIIARENMKVYAYVSIFEVVMKLVIVYILVYFSYDKLKLYASLMFLVTCIITFIYRTVCKQKYAECRFHFYWDKGLFYTLIGYSGWNLFGAMAGILNNQGINILLNIFFGPVVNAARAIAYRVNDAVNQFVMNFLTAVRPQITKYYAAEENDKMMKLVFQSSKFSFFLLFLLSMPVLLETNYIFEVWLKETPEYVVAFTRLVIITALIDSLSYPLMTAAQATGEIKRYQAVVGGTMLLNLPISYCFLKAGFFPQVTMYIAIVISIICFSLRLWLLKGMVGLSIRDYFKKVILIVLSVSFMAYALPFSLTVCLNESFMRFIIIGTTGLVISVAAIYLIGLSKDERQFFLQLIENKLNSMFKSDQLK
jgi:O-antigen/teichoic acid export membrane protein